MGLLKKFFKILFYLNFIKLSLTSCYLNYWNNAWLNQWSLLLTQEGRNNYQLFRGQHVPQNSNIYMLCSRDSQLITVHCDRNNNLDHNLPLANNCPENHNIKPARVELRETYCPSPYKLYRIGYEIPIGHHNTQFLEAYQVCFDQRHMRTIFTINEAYPVAGIRPDLKFSRDDIFTNEFFHAYDRRVAVQTFNRLLGSRQNKMIEGNPDQAIDRGHLTPSADFTFVNLKNSTFSMINVIPQFRTINNNNWRLIEEWTRRTQSDVCTGVLDCDLDIRLPDCVVKLKNNRRQWVPMFLAKGRKIPIPLWTYKIVKNSEQSLVFLTLNNIHHVGEVRPPPGKCQIINCPLTLPQTVKDGYTFCCNYNGFIDANVPRLRGIC